MARLVSMSAAIVVLEVSASYATGALRNEVAVCYGFRRIKSMHWLDALLLADRSVCYVRDQSAS